MLLQKPPSLKGNRRPEKLRNLKNVNLNLDLLALNAFYSYDTYSKIEILCAKSDCL